MPVFTCWIRQLFLGGYGRFGKLQDDLAYVAGADFTEAVEMFVFDLVIDIASSLYGACPVELSAIDRHFFIFISDIAAGKFQFHAYLTIFPVKCKISAGV